MKKILIGWACILAFLTVIALVDLGQQKFELACLEMLLKDAGTDLEIEAILSKYGFNDIDAYSMAEPTPWDYIKSNFK